QLFDRCDAVLRRDARTFGKAGNEIDARVVTELHGKFESAGRETIIAEQENAAELHAIQAGISWVSITILSVQQQSIRGESADHELSRRAIKRDIIKGNDAERWGLIA